MKKVEEKIVTGCLSCPAIKANDMSFGYSCGFDKDNRLIEEDSLSNPVDPEWCPLNSKKFLIKK